MDRNDWTRTGNRTVRSGVSSDDFPLKRRHSGIGPGVCQGLARSGFPQGFALVRTRLAHTKLRYHPASFTSARRIQRQSQGES